MTEPITVPTAMSALAEGILSTVNGGTLLVVALAVFVLVAEWLEEHP